MYRFLLVTIFVFFISITGFAQHTDSLFIANTPDDWYLLHDVHPGETLFSLSRRYHVPPAILANANHISYNGDLTGTTSLKIPIGAYNKAVTSTSDTRPVYYRVAEGDNLYRISRKAGVQQYKLQQLNHMPDNEVKPGDILLTGYMLYDATELQVVQQPRVPGAASPATTQQQPATPGNVPALQTDTALVAVDTGISKGEQAYLDQLGGDTLNVLSEKGPAAFFPMSGSNITGTYLAFHNTVPKGTIMKVHNPGNGKDVYVKIIGKLPPNKKFYNTIIGISNRARADLGTVEQRLWVELNYKGQ